jgi:hypothetical protein
MEQEEERERERERERDLTTKTFLFENVLHQFFTLNYNFLAIFKDA